MFGGLRECKARSNPGIMCQESIAVAGDVVDIKDGKLFINGEELDEPYVQGITEVPIDGIEVPYTVEEDKVFVLGDNRENSVDSRTFGAVLTQEVQGKLLFVQ